MLKDGYPYEVIMQLSVTEINLILAIDAALVEREQDEHERLQRVQQTRTGR